jgi:hypothetical protein
MGFGLVVSVVIPLMLAVLPYMREVPGRSIYSMYMYLLFTVPAAFGDPNLRPFKTF